jgi:NADP-dependent 3-hydroxy acid dehydrogenase YdfG
VRIDEDIVKAVTTTERELGKIDILFNNAGVCAYGLTHELTEKEWDVMLDINLKGAWMVARRIIPIMISQRSGVIINNSSIAGLRGMNRLSHYAASKWD